MHDFNIRPDLLETITPGRFDPKWRPEFVVRIAGSREDAIAMDDNDSAAIQVYSDGSGMEGQIGAGAVLYRNGVQKRSLRMLLGSEEDHTVPEAEGIGLILGLELIRAESRATRVSLAADNLASITRTTDTKATPAHYIWDIFHNRWKMVMRKHSGIRMCIRWVPGHEGVPGNEEADRLAKMAITEGSSPRNDLPAPLRKGLPRSRAAAQRALQAGLKVQARRTWQDSPRYNQMKSIDDSMPSRKFLKMVAALPRKKASLLFQLRSGHVPLRAHLFRINRAETAECQQCGAKSETAHHFLMVCPAYATARQRMALEGGRDALRMSALLTDTKLSEHLFRFIARTKRFEETMGDLNKVL
jgi:ribonuclease HI